MAKKEKKKKKIKTKLLLGCIEVPSSNEESYSQPAVDSSSVDDEKKAEKKRKKLAKIAARNEKKERKKREKLDKKLGKVGLEDEAPTTSKDEKKKKSKKKKKRQKEIESDLDGDEAAISTRKSIGDDSVVVTEIPMDDVTTIKDERKEAEGKMEPVVAMTVGSKKNKKKRKTEVDGDVATCGSEKVRTAESHLDGNPLSERIEENAIGDAEVPTVIGEIATAPIDAEEDTEKREKKKSKKKKKSLESGEEMSRSTVVSSSLSESVNSNVSSLSSLPAAEDHDEKKKKKKKSKKRKGEERSDEETTTMTDVASMAQPTVEHVGNNSAGDCSISTPVSAGRPSKKKSKALREAESAAGSDGDTPTKDIKNELISELKRKMKKQQPDDSATTAPQSPLSTPPSTTNETKLSGDDVFTTPNKVGTKGETPARVVMGQWGNVELGSSEKTQKFFRLLGGLKKPNGSPLSFRSSKGSTSTADGEATTPESAIVAMGKKDAETLNNKLEEQFKKALGGIGKGKVGLGFSPQLDPANKMFHIDANASKSVKF